MTQTLPVLADEVNWRLRGLCTPAVAHEHNVGRFLAPVNLRALRRCDTCPVVAACYFDTQSAPPSLRSSTIAGGRYWDSRGNERKRRNGRAG